MKQFLAVVLLGALLMACKKGSSVQEQVEDSTCYQCKSPTPPRNWQDVGCFTDAEWNNFVLKDGSGNPLDKNANCRKK